MATALIRLLAWEPPYAMGIGPRKGKKTKKKKKKKRNTVGSVLTSYLSIHQQNCCYGLRSPSRGRPITFTHWVLEIAGTSQECGSLGLPHLMSTKEAGPVSFKGQPDATRDPALSLPLGTISLPSFLPSLSTGWEPKGGCGGRNE